MKNRITALFERKQQGILSIFFTAGFPDRDDTLAICEVLEEAGVDLIELGFPYSDSLVDGPTIQIANEKALQNGMTLELYFSQVREIRKRVELPILFMCCMNPLLQFGMERFCQSCSESGIDGVIIPDMPADEYGEKFRELFESRNLSVVFLVTSRTPEERVKFYDGLSEGFLYAVSSEATTGGALEVDESRSSYLRRLQELELNNPVLVGFGISDHSSFQEACSLSSGAVIGSAFIRALQGAGELREKAGDFVRMIRGGEKIK